MATRTDIGEALAGELNAASDAGAFAPWTFEAERAYVPHYDLEAGGGPAVTVIVRSHSEEAANRGAAYEDVEIDVAVQQKVASTESAEIDPLVELVESIMTYLRDRRLAALPQVRWRRTTNAPIYIPEHLAEKLLFTSVITLAYRAMST